MTAYLLAFLLACSVGDSGVDSSSALTETDLACRAVCDHLYVDPCQIATYSWFGSHALCYDACDRVDGGRDVGLWAACVNSGIGSWDNADDNACVPTLSGCGDSACAALSVAGYYDDPAAVPDGC